MESEVKLNAKQRQKYALIAAAVFLYQDDSDSSLGVQDEFFELAKSLCRRAGLDYEEMKQVFSIGNTNKLKEFAKNRW